MHFKLIRHATLHIHYNGLNLLVDPMLAEKGSLEPVRNSPNLRRNPLVDLPLEENTIEILIDQLDAVLVTHTHFDHWDERAREVLPKGLQVFCQPEDTTKLSQDGFQNCDPIESEVNWRDVRIIRTSGQHGSGEVGRLMGPVSGFVLAAEGEPTLYIAGDTIWCDEVAAALDRFHPTVIVVNAGAAQFNQGDPITMTGQDVGQVCQASQEAKVIAVHMEAINHCLLGRAALATELATHVGSGTLIIPEDGQPANF